MISHDCRWINTVGIKSDYSLDNPLHTTINEYTRQGGIQYYSYTPPSKSLQSHSRSYAHITLQLLLTTPLNILTESSRLYQELCCTVVRNP